MKGLHATTRLRTGSLTHQGVLHRDGRVLFACLHNHRTVAVAQRCANKMLAREASVNLDGVDDDRWRELHAVYSELFGRYSRDHDALKYRDFREDRDKRKSATEQRKAREVRA